MTWSQAHSGTRRDPQGSVPTSPVWSYTRCEEIRRGSPACVPVAGRFRRALLRRFPYSVYYVVEGDAIVVVGTFHCARRPATISANVQDRVDGRLSLE